MKDQHYPRHATVHRTTSWPSATNVTVDAIVFAWWAGYGARHERTDEQGRMEHVYVSRLRPTKPLEIGMRIGVVAMANSKGAEEVTTLDDGEPYDPHIVGAVTDVRRRTATWVRVTIHNCCRGNEVGTVQIDIPHAPGVTVRRVWLDGPENKREWIGETPDGALGQAAVTRWCGAEGCSLERMAGPRGGTFRTRPGRHGKPIEREEKEGTFALHMWLRYEDSV